MRFRYILMTGLIAGIFTAVVGLASVPANAACGAVINGRPMTDYECWLVIQAYGYVEPGYYVADAYGNWAKVGDQYWRGNIWMDSQIPSSGGGWANGGGGGGRWTSTTIDPSGGCEGGSCVNILD